MRTDEEEDNVHMYELTIALFVYQKGENGTHRLSAGY